MPDRRTWLSDQHSNSTGVWLALAKKGTTHPTALIYDDALVEAICFGLDRRTAGTA